MAGLPTVKVAIPSPGQGVPPPFGIYALSPGSRAGWIRRRVVFLVLRDVEPIDQRGGLRSLPAKPQFAQA